MIKDKMTLYERNFDNIFNKKENDINLDITEKKLDVILISLHGRISYHNMELGIDLDTGGQVKYVVELANALSKHKNINHVYLLTRLINDKNIDSIYHQPKEIINSNASIIRLPCGPVNKYLRKEDLWEYIWEYVDEAYKFITRSKIAPSIIHGHYAESCEIASYLSSMLDIPCAITAHSLGKNKLEILLNNDLNYNSINNKFNIERRIEAEEISLEHADVIFNSTNHEVDTQWDDYDVQISKNLMQVIPPGVEELKYNETFESDIIETIESFLHDKTKNLILLLTRPSKKKNIESAIKAYGQSEYLKEKCNLLLILGNREDINYLDDDSKNVLTDVLLLIDKYNLYGKVAYPKHHKKEDIPIIYNYVKNSEGIFINPAYIEPFGLTLVESAFFGIPIIATKNGGPVEIIKNLENGLLIDPYSVEDIQTNIEKIFQERKLYLKYSQSANLNVRKYYSWEQYCDKYYKMIFNINYKTMVEKTELDRFKNKKFLFTDIDNTLLGESEYYNILMKKLNNKSDLILCLTSGRDFDSIKTIINDTNYDINNFDIIICSVGTEIYIKDPLNNEFKLDENHATHIDFRWDPIKIKKVLQTVNFLEEQSHLGSQSYFKISYNNKKNCDIEKLRKKLRHESMVTNIIHSHEKYCDFIPIRASKGKTLRYIINKYNLKYNNIVTAGDSGNDQDMMTGKIKSIVVGNYSQELESLKGRNNVYFSNKAYANGVLDGLQHYGFI
ncbi:Sucrose-6F-phosphate phosphohydrolase [seawater metagenome]|uniref:sucrose-phosphate synthase n=1 Tax=seawater metagenome TaxID=1561972 RepID=A0A5E8CLT8_9ZZZZ